MSEMQVLAFVFGAIAALGVIAFLDWLDDKSTPDDGCCGHHFAGDGHPPLAGCDTLKVKEVAPAHEGRTFKLRKKRKVSCGHEGCHETKTKWVTAETYTGETKEEALPEFLYENASLQ